MYSNTILLILSLSEISKARLYTNKFLITMSNDNLERVNEIVGKYGLKYQRQILSNVHVYELLNAPAESKVHMREKELKAMKNSASGMIEDIYQSEIISLPVKNITTSKSKLYQHFIKPRRKRSLQRLLQCSPSYGMHIMDAWALGYRGEGIVVGIADTGAEVTHPDLGPNIDHDLSRNFIRGTTDVKPDIFPSYAELDVLSDHGNNCAGLVAAVQGNDICSSGVAPDAKLAVLKIIEVNDPSRDVEVFRFRPDALVEALSYKMEQIHIYSNSYGPKKIFSASTRVINEAFKEGVMQGRKGKGSIYVIATGNKGHSKNANLDGYVNSMYTIAINSVGVNGTIPDFVQPGACILASTYGEGHNSFEDCMLTTSHRNSCTTEFKQTSASAAIASGMIALLLQANPDLTWRDVQHIIVNTSSVAKLEGYEKVITNTAGFTYNYFFGFGLMNASALVAAAKNWTNVPSQKIVYAAKLVKDRGKKTAVHNLSVTVCEMSEHCLSFTEHVVLQVEYMSYYDSLVELQVCAPSKTCSDILTARTVNHTNPKKRIKRKWNFMTLQFWGENPNGTWKLKMRLSVPDKRFTLMFLNITVYGYSKDSQVHAYSEGLEKIVKYASGKIEEKADVLEQDIPEKQAHTANKILIFIGQVFLFTITAASIITLCRWVTRRYTAVEE